MNKEFLLILTAVGVLFIAFLFTSCATSATPRPCHVTGESVAVCSCASFETDQVYASVKCKDLDDHVNEYNLVIGK